MAEESVFAKIIKGEIPSYKVYEDDKTLAFLDIYRRLLGIQSVGMGRILGVGSG